MSPAVLAASDRRAQAAKSECEFRDGWEFKGDAVERIDEMMAGTPGPVIHVCCGAGYLKREDLRVDLYHPSADRAWDAQQLDKRLAEEGIVAGVIVMDPPFGKKMWDLAKRQRVVNACMRSLPPGGLFIVHAPWQPKFNKVAEVERFMWRRDTNLGFPDSPVLLVAYRKTEDPAFSNQAKKEGT